MWAGQLWCLLLNTESSPEVVSNIHDQQHISVIALMACSKVYFISFQEINTFTRQGRIKLIKIDSKDKLKCIYI